MKTNHNSTDLFRELKFFVLVHNLIFYLRQHILAQLICIKPFSLYIFKYKLIKQNQSKVNRQAFHNFLISKLSQKKIDRFNLLIYLKKS